MSSSKLQPASCPLIDSSHSGLDPSTRPFIVLLADARGTEAPDLLAPCVIFSESGAVDVRIVSARREPIRLTQGVGWIAPQMTVDELDRIGRPDVMIVPALAGC